MSDGQKRRPANRACASIHPHNGIVQRKASGFTPHNSGFPLICDPNGLQTSDHIVFTVFGFVNCLLHAHLIASSISTNVSAHKDTPGHRLISIRDLIAPPPDSSHSDSADEGYVFVHERVAPDFSGVRDREAFLTFQAAADYCFAYSDDSSEEDYDLARKFSMVELAERGNDTADSPTNRPVEPPTNSTAPRAATPSNLVQS